MILFLTRPSDFHTFFVEEALLRKGGKPVLWHTSDFPRLQTWSVESRGDGEATADLQGPEFELHEIPRVVWDRRSGPPTISGRIHPADRKFAEGECRTLYQWIYVFLANGPFWVNPPQASRTVASKIWQQVVARDIGLSVPPTLYSNDPGRIRAFAKKHREIIYKPLTQGGMWALPGKGVAALYTAIAKAEVLADDEVLSATPGIFQPVVPKKHELRVTVIGDHIFPAKIRSQEMKRGQLDWRVDPLDLQIEPTTLPNGLEGAIRALMKALGLIFGCLDFIVTPADDCVFLEVNDMGQFLFVEALTEIPLLDAFSELLLQGRPDFRWEPSTATVRMCDLEGMVQQRVKEAEEKHVSPPDFFSVELIPKGMEEPEVSPYEALP